MEFNFQRVNSQMENDDHTRYFHYTSFSDHEGVWRSGTGGGGVEILRGSVELTEAIQREKDMIREEIMAAAAAARRRVLEAEVWRELMLETQNGGGGGYHRSSTFTIGPPISQTTRLLPVMPFAPAEGYGGGGRHDRDIGAFWPPGDGGPKVISLPDGPTNRKPPPPPAAACGSSVLKHFSGGGEIGLGVAPKKSVKKQPSSNKNSRKCVSIDSKTEDKKTELSLWCSMCGVGATSKIGMSQHKEGKKHMKNLEKLNRESRDRRALGVRKRSYGMKQKKTKRKHKSHKVARHQ